ncbi:MAG: LamG-like jellyroll fold domain-containing protein, partial [Pirellulaceae bacterium]
GFNTDDLDTTATFPQDLNTWTFLCFTFNTTNRLQAIYRNGAFVQSRTSIAQLQTVERSMRIGRFRLATGYANGRIDDFRVYMDKVFTQDEINELYKGRFTFYQDDTSGGSGGGGGGGNALNINNQTGAVAGTPFNAT